METHPHETFYEWMLEFFHKARQGHYLENGETHPHFQYYDRTTQSRHTYPKDYLRSICYAEEAQPSLLPPAWATLAFEINISKTSRDRIFGSETGRWAHHYQALQHDPVMVKGLEERKTPPPPTRVELLMEV